MALSHCFLRRLRGFWWRGLSLLRFSFVVHDELQPADTLFDEAEAVGALVRLGRRRGVVREGDGAAKSGPFWASYRMCTCPQSYWVPCFAAD